MDHHAPLVLSVVAFIPHAHCILAYIPTDGGREGGRQRVREAQTIPNLVYPRVQYYSAAGLLFLSHM